MSSDNENNEPKELPSDPPEPRLEEVVRESPKKLPNEFAYWDDVWGHWGEKPDEFVVVNCDYNTNTYGLSKFIAECAVRQATFDQLAPPNSNYQRPPEHSHRFYCGDLVRLVNKESK